MWLEGLLIQSARTQMSPHTDFLLHWQEETVRYLWTLNFYPEGVWKLDIKHSKWPTFSVDRRFFTKYFAWWNVINATGFIFKNSLCNLFGFLFSFLFSAAGGKLISIYLRYYSGLLPSLKNWTKLVTFWFLVSKVKTIKSLCVRLALLAMKVI